MLRAAREGAADAEREKRRHEGDERDHAKMLDLPENLGELDKERRCEFVKKAYKKAALRWHPDKAQSAAGKVRAARKMNEMTEARDHVSERLGCVAPKNNGDERGGHPGGGHPGGGHPGGTGSATRGPSTTRSTSGGRTRNFTRGSNSSEGGRGRGEVPALVGVLTRVKTYRWSRVSELHILVRFQRVTPML